MKVCMKGHLKLKTEYLVKNLIWIAYNKNFIFYGLGLTKKKAISNYWENVKIETTKQWLESNKFLRMT